MKGIVIKRIFSLILLLSIVDCKTTQLPEVSTKLESVFKEQEKFYKNQKVWRYVRGEYKYDRRVIDSIFTQYNLQDSEEFYIITSRINSELHYSLEIKSYDKNLHLAFVKEKNKLVQIDGDLSRMSYYLDFKDLGGGDFIDFMKNKSQEELNDCSKTAPMINHTMVLFTYYNKGAISVKRYVTCDYAEYYNWEIPKEEDWE